MRLSVRLFFAPSGSGDKQELGIRSNSLRVALGSTDASECPVGGVRKGNLYLIYIGLQSGLCWSFGPRFVACCVHDEEPRPGLALDHRFKPLPIEPTLGGYMIVDDFN